MNVGGNTVHHTTMIPPRANPVSGNPLPLAAALLAFSIAFGGIARADDFRVDPYLQNPADDAMTIMWLSQANTAGSISFATGGGGPTVVNSTPVLASALSYHASEPGPDPGTPYLHQVRLAGLTPGAVYDYTVTQGAAQRINQFRTAPAGGGSVRFMVCADSETEPESTGKHASWAAPAGAPAGRPTSYLVDQTTGYAENIKVMKARQPDFIAIAGDLTQAGGEQRDWDEFWRHNAGSLNNIAGSAAIMASPGNHEDYGGTAGGYATASSNAAMDKYLTYFDAPANGATNSAHEGRYYRQDYGPVTMISIDATNGLPDDTNKDTNYHLAGTANAPDFNLGSEQATWLETQLADAQQNSQFTFVFFHHVPYSVGPHGYPAGTGANEDTQSGQPVRVLMPMFQKYGVDVLFGGHDEMVERSELDGTEELPGGGTEANTIHVYDYGVAGDGLRGPMSGLTNPEQEFLAHTDSPEVWSGDQLVDGGKHYGHLEVNVGINGSGFWEATVTPVYVFPVTDTNGDLTGVFERRRYDDEVVVLGQYVPGPALPGDANGDGCVDDLDLTALAVHWQQSTNLWEHGDFDGNGIVDDLDLTALAVNWQQGCGGGGSFADAVAGQNLIPEPGSALLLLLGFAGAVSRRNRNQ